MIRQVKHMGQADSTSIGPTSGANARQGAAGEFGSVECNDVESGRATDTDTTPREAAATPIRVAVVDDHEMFRAGVIATLQPYFHIVGQAADVEGSIAMIADIRPDVVLLDVHVPGGEGGGGAEILAKSQPLSPASAFLALSVSDSPQDVGSVIRAGARGYVTKTITGDGMQSDADWTYSERFTGTKPDEGIMSHSLYNSVYLGEIQRARYIRFTLHMSWNSGSSVKPTPMTYKGGTFAEFEVWGNLEELDLD